MNNKNKELLYILQIFAIVFIAILTIGIWKKLQQPMLVYQGKLKIFNKTYYLYIYNKDKTFKYICPVKLQSNDKCILTPTKMVCESSAVCIRYYDVVSIK